LLADVLAARPNKSSGSSIDGISSAPRYLVAGSSPKPDASGRDNPEKSFELRESLEIRLSWHKPQ